jgi:hypothetical protein
MKTRKIILTLAIVFALIFIGCEEEPQEHESTINAFNRDITVKGNASISKDEFDTAKGKLQMAMKNLSDNLSSTGSAYTKIVNMLSRPNFAIMITKGDASPASADEKKTMTIGVEYLINSSVEVIENDIVKKVNTDNAFAD